MTDREKFFYLASVFLLLPALLIFSLVFSQERLYGDSADYLFQMLQTGDFFIAHKRPSSVFIEWLPLLFIKFGAPLEYVLYAFSLAEFLWFFAWFMVFAHGFKEPMRGIAVVLAYLFGMRFNYFNPVSELILAFPLLFWLARLWLKPPGNKAAWYALSLGIMVFLFASHALYMLVVPAVLVFYYADSGFKRRFIFIGVGAGILMLISYLSLDDYEQHIISKNTPDGLIHVLKRFFNPEKAWVFAKNYAGMLLLAAFVLWRLIKDKARVQAVVFVGFLVAAIGLVYYKYSQAYLFTELFERYLFIVPLFVCVIAVPYLKYMGRLTQLALLGVALWHLVGIARFGHFVKQRYYVFNGAIANASQFAENKLLYRKENYYAEINPPENGHDWIQCIESLVLTSLKGPQNTKQVFVKEILPDEFYADLKDDGFMFNYVGWYKNVSELNPRYMRMYPSPWRVANTDSLQPQIDNAITQQITACVGSFKPIVAGKKVLLPLTLTNASATPLYSGMRLQKRGIAYRWIKTGTNTVEEGKYLTPLMCDLHTRVEQTLLVDGPTSPGTYSLQVGYTTQNPTTFLPFKGVNIVEVK